MLQSREADRVRQLEGMNTRLRKDTEALLHSQQTALTSLTKKEEGDSDPDEAAAAADVAAGRMHTGCVCVDVRERVSKRGQEVGCSCGYSGG